MANNKMLIDAAHSEETRVVMVRGNRVDEFDFESEHKTQLRGNIYLAKVTRVEPSLQAAFVDYGGNRHGFLAFSEIHPDYYQIPVADRQALLDAEAEDARAAAKADDEADIEADSDGEDDTEVEAEAVEKPMRKRRSRRKKKDTAEDEAVDAKAADEEAESADAPEESDDSDEEMSADNDGDDVVSEEAEKKPRRRTSRKKKTDDEVEAKSEEAEEKPKPKRRTSRKKVAAEEAEAETVAEETEEKPKPKRRTSRKKASEKAEDTTAEAKDAEEAPETEEKPKRRRSSRKKKDVAEVETKEAEADEDNADDSSSEDENGGEEKKGRRRRSRSRSRSRRGKRNDSDEATDDDSVDSVGSEDALEEVPAPPARRSNRRHYKIQEVIKRRQILLVQVVKEERGNKGAALTTYLSLAGRYSVLMPNTARGGGISRKITNVADRKRLKGIASALEVPQGMGVILRTAGASRDQEEIQRDFEYLMRLWENVRTLTLESTAPCLVYEEGSLIKRSIRDLYDKDTGEVMVAGEQGYREAKDFMTMLMPDHAKKVKLYKDHIPMFARMGVEAQLDAMLQPQVTLKSGGYLILDQTEALVAIDVNSGRSTRNHSVEETAVATNLEAADEVARQLRLRDLAGLIVIDFIDMEDRRNIRAVEKRLKDALKNDRARIQVGRISHFGLMEMSRQRIRASVLESTTQICPVCEGLGHVRAPSSIVLAVLRAIEEHLNRNSRNNLTVKVSTPTALYLLNCKRENLSDLETRFGVSIAIDADDTIGMTPCTIEKGELSARRPAQESAVQPDTITSETATDDAPATEADNSTAETTSEDADSDGRKKRRRRRRRKSGDREETPETADQEQKTTAEPVPAATEEEVKEDKPKRRTSRRTKKSDDDASDAQTTSEETAKPEDTEENPKRRRTARKSKKTVSDTPSDAPADSESDSSEEDKPKRRTTRRKVSAEAAEETPSAEPDEAADAKTDEKPKKGWWNRKFF